MSLLRAIDELVERIQNDPNVQSWLDTYCVNTRALQVMRTNRKVDTVEDRHLPCVILELPDGEFGQRYTGGLAQQTEHELDLIFAIQVDRKQFGHGFDARVELVDQVLPKFFLANHRFSDAIKDAKLIRYTTDSGMHFPKVFVQVTVQLSGLSKRDEA